MRSPTAGNSRRHGSEYLGSHELQMPVTYGSGVVSSLTVVPTASSPRPVAGVPAIGAQPQGQE